MSREINQEAHFSAPPHEASFAGRHLSAEALVNPERERVFATHDPRAVSTAQFATSNPHVTPLGVRNSRDLRVRASGGLKIAFLLFDTLAFGIAGASAGYSYSGGDPAMAIVGGVLGALFGFVLAAWTIYQYRR